MNELLPEARSARSLRALARLEYACTRCDLYLPATQVVPGRGPRRARLMLVGEQPGDSEDRVGEPFVGPAGRLLAQALEQAGLDPGAVYLTNAVKHFRFEQRGKRRLHKKPSAAQIDACNLWLQREIALVRPATVLALGASAARALLGRPAAVSRLRGRALELPGGGVLRITVHPSWLLRQRDQQARHREFARFVADLQDAAVP